MTTRWWWTYQAHDLLVISRILCMWRYSTGWVTPNLLKSPHFFPNVVKVRVLSLKIISTFFIVWDHVKTSSLPLCWKRLESSVFLCIFLHVYSLIKSKLTKTEVYFRFQYISSKSLLTSFVKLFSGKCCLIKPEMFQKNRFKEVYNRQYWVMMLWQWRLSLPTSIPLHVAALCQMAAEWQSDKMASHVEM